LDDLGTQNYAFLFILIAYSVCTVHVCDLNTHLVCLCMSWTNISYFVVFCRHKSGSWLGWCIWRWHAT